MLADGLYVIIDRKTGLFYNRGELKDTPKIYTEAGAKRLLEEYVRIKKRKQPYSSWTMQYKIPHYYGEGPCGAKTSAGYSVPHTFHICNFDMVECTLNAKNDADRQGHRRGCKPKGKKRL